ncbi:MAG: hypothetical protein IJX18_03015, partial [Clostridia bacterium]|nr:hypothetical protein [Clostridia bacterium]
IAEYQRKREVISLIPTIIIAIATCVLLILSVLLFPKVKIFGKSLNTYWMICLCGALLILLFQGISLEEVFAGLTTESSINPLKILVLFISMTFLSVFLDEIGFFKYLATLATKKAKTSQFTLFLALYALISVLTIFTSNDIVILTFTPFICYFAKNTKINPIPYLVAEFAAANTWSMMLIIGNPTNIYLATSAGIDFIPYLKVMALPTLFAGLTELAVILLLFRKKLKAPLTAEITDEKIADKPSLIVGLAHLGVCLVLLVVSSYIGLDMWLICLFCALSLLVCALVIALVRKRPPVILKNTAKRLPWDLIPFVISMFVVVLALEKQQITDVLSDFLGSEDIILRYGVSSFLACNLINNIPMSVLFSTLPNMATALQTQQAVYATIIGSNVGAFLTPIGALAGIMFTDLVSKQEVKYGFKSFVFYGTIIAVPTLLTALLGLIIML